MPTLSATVPSRPHAEALADSRRPLSWHGLVLGTLALLAYLLLGQQTLYRRDAHVLLQRLAESCGVHNSHFAYFPAIHLTRVLLAPLGLSLYQAARATSAIGTALGVVLVHAANVRLGLSRRGAAAVTALVACCPAVVFFATVVEVHGVFLAAFGLAALATAELVRTPSVRSALLAGAALGLARAAHATAVLLPGILLGLAYVLLLAGGLRRRRAASLCLLATLVFGLCVVAMPTALRAIGVPLHERAATDLLAHSTHTLAVTPSWPWSLPALVGREVWREWLWPAFPLSMTWLPALGRRELRGQAIAFALGMLPYLALATVLLPFFPVSEQGAYFLPLAWPAALLTVACWPRPVLGLTIGATFAVALLQVAAHDVPQRSLAFADGFRAETGGRPAYLVLGDYDDLEAYFVRLPATPHLMLVDAVAQMGPAHPDALTRTLDTELRRHASSGQEIYLTRGTARALRDLAHGGLTAADRVLESLRRRWSFVPADRGGFHAYRLRPR